MNWIRSSSMCPAFHPLRRLFVVIALAGVLTVQFGCSSSKTVVDPVSDAAEDTEAVSANDYLFLSSEKAKSEVLVHIRRVERNWLEAYVAVANRTEEDALVVSPEAITVEVSGASGVLSRGQAFSPERIPRGAAPGSIDDMNKLFALSSTGQSLLSTGTTTNPEQTITTSFRDAQNPKSASAYRTTAAPSETGLPTEVVFLRSGAIQPDGMLDGMVFAPSDSDIRKVTITVPVGDEAHTLRFNIREEKS